MSVAIEETTKTKLKKPPKFNIWALDNDITSFNEVVWILTRAFNMSESVAAELTTKIDREGRAKVNPKPMSKGLAEAQLDKVNNLKRQLAQILGHIGRDKAVMALKFIIKED